MVDEHRTKIIVGAIYMRPSLMLDINMIQKQYNDIEESLDGVLNIKGWITYECQIIICADINRNCDGDTYRETISIKDKLRGEV